MLGVRHMAALGVLLFLAASSSAMAQIQISAQMERNNFLLYERVDMLITIENAGETDLILNNNEGQPWLSFMVSKHNRLPVRQERESTFAPLTLKVGETKTLKVNLTPLFSFREEGEYKAAAVVNLPGAGDVISDNVPFTILKGNKVWSQTRPVDGSQRVYSLVRFSPEPDDTKLYLRVEAPTENLVYATLALGEMVSFIDPEVYFDPQGNIHVLQPFALSTYLYTRADSNGKILHQGIFKTFQTVAPRLTKLDDGNVIVMGGMEENPNTPREKLSDGQKKADARTAAPGSPQ